VEEARINGANHDSDRVRAVVETTQLWHSSPISVCFFEGSTLARDAVEQLASDWSNGTGVRFDFGNGRTCDPNRPSNIRVSFRRPSYWSYVGTDANLIRADQPTLNLANFDHEMDSRGGFTAFQRGTILHEFGHAIGFKHEHQSPASGCSEEFNWNALPEVLGYKPGEADEKLRTNMMRLVDESSHRLYYTEFDDNSIMLYSLDRRAFKDPDHAECYIPQQNTHLSQTDRVIAAKVYPASSYSRSLGAAPVSPPEPAFSPAVQAKLKELSDLTASQPGAQ
jgi:hypothetical protein